MPLPVVFLYGSETGNAESIALNLTDQALQRGYEACSVVMEKYETVPLEGQTVLVLIVSTTGDGDPPDNATKFWRYLRRLAKSSADWSAVHYTLLGLGDTNYDNFCNAGRRLDEKLQELKAQTFYPKGLADDATGLEEVVEPWCTGLWEPLAKVCGLVEEKSIESKSDTPSLGSTVTPATAGESTEVVQAISILDQLVLADTKSSAAPTAPVDPVEAVWQGRPLLLDFGALATLKGLTGTPRAPSSLCQVESVDNVVTTTDLPCPYQLHTVRIQSAQCLTTPDALKRTLVLELSKEPHTSSPLPTFWPGDAFGVQCPNPPALVQALVERLNLVSKGEIENPVRITAALLSAGLPSHLADLPPMTPRALFTHVVDLTIIPKKGLLRMLADYAQTDIDKTRLLFLCSKQGSAEFAKLRAQIPTLLDILNTFPSCQPPLARLLDVLPPHQPRYYSVANAPADPDSPQTLRFVFNVVQYQTPDPYYVNRMGVCTPWLQQLSHSVSSVDGNTSLTSGNLGPSSLASTSTLRVFLKPNANGFLMDKSLERPLVMVGPGTGVAPFIGFLEQRERMQQTETNQRRGETWLFYGCRHPAKDYLFRSELAGFVERGVLDRLVESFSRYSIDSTTPDAGSAPQNKYVQHQMQRYAADIYRLMTKENAVLYVCGDAQGMAKDVHETLAQILVDVEKDTEDPLHHIDSLPAAKLQLVHWMQEGRYLRDLWA
ncbi:hypothetical protein IWQ61_003129 [Dispira simplex]|nr:hypothetical protein IWQ61_003129 [Dispira simplex]